MKILQVIPTLGHGGAEHFVVELTNELIHQGYQCDLLTMFDISDDNDLLSKLSPKACYLTLHKKSGFDISCYYKLYKLIKKGRYDIVHSHIGAIPYTLFSTFLFKNVRFIATIHSEARREAGSSLMKWSRFYMFLHHKCVPVTISDESKKSFLEYYHIDAPLVYNGVSNYKGSRIPSLRDNEGQILFVHPASCQPVKNQELLIKAFAKLVKEYPNSKMLWVGSLNSYKSLYESLIPLMVKQFQYLGIVPNVRDYLLQADAMCLSSKMEGMPMSIIESFSVGCPVLCTPVGGIIDMVRHEENGMLSKSLSVDDYYSMLKSFCNLTQQKRDLMKQQAKKSFELYSISETAKGYLKIYTSKKIYQLK